jgi:aspartyl-tRNA(Asn)/glutamyl-tRNA(Gln) amidotransferase subunit B
MELSTSPLSAPRLARLIALVESGTVSRNGARELLEAVLDRDGEPEALAAELGLEQEDTTEELVGLIAGITAEHPQAVEQIRSGDLKPLGFLVGQVMKASGGRADPKQVQSLLRRQFEI